MTILTGENKKGMALGILLSCGAKPCGRKEHRCLKMEQGNKEQKQQKSPTPLSLLPFSFSNG
jgi:hypothetical protein